MKQFQLFSQLHKASRQVAIHMDEACRPYGVSGSEAHLLGYTTGYGPVSINELHRVLGHQRSTLTAMLDRLERRGLIARQANPVDRRSLLIAVEPAGKELAAQLHALHIAVEARIIGQLTAEELAGFRAVTSTIGEVIGIELRQR